MIHGTIAILNQGTTLAPLGLWLRAQPRNWHVLEPRGSEIAHQRNEAVLGMQGEWLFFVDSDCLPPVEALLRLESRDLPLVGGVVLDRSPLMEVCALKTFEPTVRYGLREIPGRGVMPVLALGTGCMLIHRKVLTAVGIPWFTCGQLVSDVITEDAEFCLRAAERGYPPFLDCEVRTGHKISGILWPGQDEEIWVQWDGAPYRQPLGSAREHAQDGLPLYR